MTALWWLAALALTVRVALYYRERALYFRACKDTQVDETVRVAQIAKENDVARRAAEAESARLVQVVRDGEAAYAGLLESLKVGGMVRVPTDEQLARGEW